LARVQRLALCLPGEAVLSQAHRAAAVADRKCVGVLRGPALADLVDDLERVIDLPLRRHVEEGTSAPERGARGLELVAVQRQAAQVVALEERRVILRGLFQAAKDHSALGQLGVELDVNH
jgi:hypothetical protein